MRGGILAADRGVFGRGGPHERNERSRCGAATRAGVPQDPASGPILPHIKILTPNLKRSTLN